MSSQNLFAPILMACVLVAGFFSLAAVASAASTGKSVLKARESARTYQLESTHRRRVRIPLPIGPSYIYYDYPYYYSRGYYPTHIGGYVYYPHRAADLIHVSTTAAPAVDGVALQRRVIIADVLYPVG